MQDAPGTLDLFQQLGFEQLTAPLLDELATGEAIQALATDDLREIGPEDSLVLFYAGHGSTRNNLRAHTRRCRDGPARGELAYHRSLALLRALGA